MLGLVAFSLISVVSAGNQDASPAQVACEDELYRELDQATSVEVVETILDGVEEKDTTTVGHVSVATLSSYKDSSCKVEPLTFHHLSECLNVDCGHGPNKGVMLYLDTYEPKRIESCTKEVLAFFEGAVPLQDKQIVAGFCSELSDSQEDKNDYERAPEYYEKVEKLAKEIFKDQRHELFSSCIVLIDKLTRYMSKYALPISSLANARLGSWHDKLMTCKTYVKSRCLQLTERQYELVFIISPRQREMVTSQKKQCYNKGLSWMSKLLKSSWYWDWIFE